MRQISCSLGPTAVFPVLEAAAAADDFRVNTAEFQSLLLFLPVDPKTASVFTYDVQIPLCLQKPAVNIRLTRWNPNFFFSSPGCQTSPLNPRVAARTQDFGRSSQPHSSPRLSLRHCSQKLPLHNGRATSKSANLQICVFTELTNSSASNRPSS